MGMIKSISLKNYKCFKELKQTEFAPLTLLCGANSSGKSSLVNGLLLLKQSYEGTEVENGLRLNGDYVKCGKMADISHKMNEKDVTIEVGYELKKPPKYEKGSANFSKSDVTAYKNLIKIFSALQPKEFSVTSSVTLRKDALRVNDNILQEQTIVIRTLGESGEETISSIKLVRKKGAAVYCVELKNLPSGEKGEFIQEVTLNKTVCYFENFTLVNAYSSNIQPSSVQVSGVLANVYLICKMNALQFKNVSYLTPLRVYPQRNYVLMEDKEDVGIGGEFTANILSGYKKKIDGIVPPKDDRIIYDVEKLDLSECLSDWMDYLGFGKYSIDSALETVQMNVNGYNITNVGFGVSQVLPILVNGLIKSRNEVMCLEQPEIHLHPKAQMCMADFLITLAGQGRGLLVETHSDHIVNRVVRRMMEDPSVRKLVKIYFVDQDSDGVSSVEEVKVDAVRGFLIENENFFTQFASETERIMYVGFQNKQKGVQ